MADTSSDGRYPATIVLTRRGLNPDVHLQVFGQDFHAHSMILKMNSEFFRSFFDSADKDLPASDPRFKYMWVTKVDDDGTWSLVWEHAKKDPNEASHSIVGDIPIQINAFKTILCAMYNRGIVLESVTHLVLCTELADYYRCLPMFTLAVTSAMMNSASFLQSIPNQCCKLLETAAKLRNKTLFKECLIHTTGPWASPRYRALQDPLLKSVGEKAYRSIIEAIAKYHEGTLTHAHNDGSHAKFGEDVEAFKLKVARQCPLDSNGRPLGNGREYRLRLPEYYRKLYTEVGRGIPQSYESLLKPLVKSNLCLDRSGAISGQGAYAQYFLCADINDEDLPWDFDQDDW